MFAQDPGVGGEVVAVERLGPVVIHPPRAPERRVGMLERIGLLGQDPRDVVRPAPGRRLAARVVVPEEVEQADVAVGPGRGHSPIAGHRQGSPQRVGRRPGNAPRRLGCVNPIGRHRRNDGPEQRCHDNDARAARLRSPLMHGVLEWQGPEEVKRTIFRLGVASRVRISHNNLMGRRWGILRSQPIPCVRSTNQDVRPLDALDGSGETCRAVRGLVYQERWDSRWSGDPGDIRPDGACGSRGRRR